MVGQAIHIATMARVAALGVNATLAQVIAASTGVAALGVAPALVLIRAGNGAAKAAYNGLKTGFNVRHPLER